jgi:hypothetical protein
MSEQRSVITTALNNTSAKKQSLDQGVSLIGHLGTRITSAARKMRSS